MWGRIGHRWSHLAANFASRWTSNDGFTTGQLGGGGGSNVAVLAGRPCEGRPQIAVRLNVKGTVESITNNAITVKPRDGSNSQTCARKPVSPSLNGYDNGNRVEMGCGVVDNTLTLLRIHKLRCRLPPSRDGSRTPARDTKGVLPGGTPFCRSGVYERTVSGFLIEP